MKSKQRDRGTVAVAKSTVTVLAADRGESHCERRGRRAIVPLGNGDIIDRQCRQVDRRRDRDGTGRLAALGRNGTPVFRGLDPKCPSAVLCKSGWNLTPPCPSAEREKLLLLIAVTPSFLNSVPPEMPLILKVRDFTTVERGCG